MRRILVAYAGVNGMTRSCAERLAKELKGTDVTLCDLEKEIPTISDYDVCVAGSCVRRGKLRPAAKRFLEETIAGESDCPTGVFLCCGFVDRFEEYRDRLIPKAVRERAFLISNFGGTLNPAGKPFWDRLWLFFARSGVVESEIDDGEYTPTLPAMNPENIGQMAFLARTLPLVQK